MARLGLDGKSRCRQGWGKEGLGSKSVFQLLNLPFSALFGILEMEVKEK